MGGEDQELYFLFLPFLFPVLLWEARLLRPVSSSCRLSSKFKFLPTNSQYIYLQVHTFRILTHTASDVSPETLNYSHYQISFVIQQ